MTKRNEETMATEGSEVRSVPQSTLPRKKISIRQTPEEEAQAHNYFQPHVFDPNFKTQLTQSVRDSQPYRWGTIRNLIDETLLRNVRREIMDEIQFTKKETDIYKVFQSGDLANLSAMPADLLKRLPSLYKLRSAIYSQTFRDYVSDVTGAGKLSGVKTDLSLQLYTKTCHLLTHDDVIGSRRVSFILYMPDPDTMWKPHYGGGLQLLDSIVPNVPRSDIHSTLTPQFNQIAFFTVQPGKSFHAVEEVRVDKQRLSLQGWFHIPQVGEEAYIPGEQEATEAKSTLHQLESRELREYDFPKQILRPVEVIAADDLALTDRDRLFLGRHMNESLLSASALSRLADIFNEDSVVDIMSFLNGPTERTLRHALRHGELNEYPPMPQCEAEVAFPWKLAIPAHKHRYLYMDGAQAQDISSEASIAEINQCTGPGEANFALLAQMLPTPPVPADVLDVNPNSVHANETARLLLELAALFASLSFKKWLYQITHLEVLREQILVRRFRPGHDFVLATKQGTEAAKDDSLEGLLEATLNLTPTPGWENGDHGAYELCMVDEEPEAREMAKTGSLNEDEAAIYKTADADAVVYEGQTCFNKLNLMFRDPSVMKFVKYVSAGAPGSRYDVVGAWKCREGQ